MGNTYYIGWDVGAWNCPRKKFAVQSQDCITVLYENKKGELILIWAWMGNVSSQICASTCGSLFNFINGLIKSDNNDNIITKKDNFSLQEDDKIIVAIDASLGLPQNAVSIANLKDKGYPTEIAQLRTNNPMLYRYTEQWIDKYVFNTEGNLPLSAIQDQIGSQATKALYALKKMGFRWNPRWNPSKYIWTTEEGKYTAIETYPTACRKCISLADNITNIWSSIHKDILKLDNKTNWWLSPASKNNTEPEKAESKTYIKCFSDLYDSILCALTAKAFNSSVDLVNNPERKDMGISAADKTRITNEGWIWIPWT